MNLHTNLDLTLVKREKAAKRGGKCEIRLPFLACEVGKGSEKRGKCEIRLPFLACEAGKGSEKRGKREIRLPFSACEDKVLIMV